MSSTNFGSTDYSSLQAALLWVSFFIMGGIVLFLVLYNTSTNLLAPCLCLISPLFLFCFFLSMVPDDFENYHPRPQMGVPLVGCRGCSHFGYHAQGRGGASATGSAHPGEVGNAHERDTCSWEALRLMMFVSGYEQASTTKEPCDRSSRSPGFYPCNVICMPCSGSCWSGMYLPWTANLMHRHPIGLTCEKKTCRENRLRRWGCCRGAYVVVFM